jgi:methylmalonyl-CoA/ethylmalonyl-CoA epimerase
VLARAIHHVGIAVEDLDEAVETYERFFGGQLEGRGTIHGQRVEAASLVLGSGRVELVAALHEDSTVARFIARRGPGMHHIAYEVDDVQSALDGLAEEGVQLIDTEPHEGLFGLQVAFIHPESVYGVLSEVVSSGG